MSLSSRVKNKLVDTMNTCFASIGHATGMKMPKCESNLAPIAWEFFVAKHVLSLAEKRKENAQKAAIAAGVLFDQEKTPRPPGREVAFNGEILSIVAEIKNPAKRVNTDKFVEFLIQAGVKHAVVDAAREAATTVNRSAVTFTPYLVTDGTDNGK